MQIWLLHLSSVRVLIIKQLRNLFGSCFFICTKICTKKWDRSSLNLANTPFGHKCGEYYSGPLIQELNNSYFTKLFFKYVVKSSDHVICQGAFWRDSPNPAYTGL